MKRLIVSLAVLLLAGVAFSFTYGGSGSNGFATGESLTASNMNEIDAALDALEAGTSIASSITRDTEWDTAAEINAATTDSDFITNTGSGLFLAESYASGSSTGGIEEAINAACSAGSGVVRFTGDITTSATINLDCEGVILEGSSWLDVITFAAGSTGIVASGDKTQLRNFTITPASSNASNIGIQLRDGTTSAAADVVIDHVYVLGVSGSGKGISCNTCLRSKVVNGSLVAGWDVGIYGQDEDAPTDVDPNAFAVIGSAIRSNTTYGIQWVDLTSVMTVHGSTLESNGIGVQCESSQGVYQSVGNHYENTGAADIKRPTTNGCGVVSVGDRFGSVSTVNFDKNSSGATRDLFVAPYFSGNGISNSTAECVGVIFAANVGTATLTEGDVCRVGIAQGTDDFDWFSSMRLFDVADCSSYTAEGEVCWDNDGNFLSIGDGSGVKVFAPTSAFSGDATVSTSGVVAIQANSVALSTDTTGNYVATIADSGASEVTVSGSGSEGAAVTLALASTITRDSELRAFTVSASAASGSCTAGDLWLKTSATVTLYACTATDTWSTGVGI